MDLSLFFLGTGGSVPSARRGLPAVLMSRGGERVLFDCGEGTQRQMLRSVGLSDLHAIFITHFHADHWLGLPGMLKSFALRDREAPLEVFGPGGLHELMRAMRVIYGTRLPYELRLTEVEPWEEVGRDGYLVAAVPVNHRDRGALGYAVVEHARPGEFDPREAARLGVEPGPDFGRLQRGEAVGGVLPEQVMGQAREGRRLVISGDTAPVQALAVAARGADVLVHEATFTEEEAARAAETRHSTARQAALIAEEAGAGMLALTHISSRYAGEEIRAEACATFPASEVMRDFDTIEIPFPERGLPVLERWSDRRARERSAAPDGADGGRPGAVAAP